MFPRHIAPLLSDALADTPVVLLSGARQTGKSTLVQGLRIPTKLDSDSTGRWTHIPEQAGQSARSDAGWLGFTRVMPSWSSCRAWA